MVLRHSAVFFPDDEGLSGPGEGARGSLPRTTPMGRFGGTFYSVDTSWHSVLANQRLVQVIGMK